FKAGAGYLPLDPGLPSQRLSRIIDLSRTPLLVCTEACREQAEQLLEEFACSGRPKLLVWEALDERDENPGVYSGPDNLAYVIYTSGSTGLPKG
ncbi:AMP-binding protein, partial [Klebsiella pneumoniae]